MLGLSPTDLTFKYHGNYCGPNHGDPDFKQEAIDKLDQICKKHDLEYDTLDADLFYADLNFANEAISEDLFSGSYFYLQSALRFLNIMARKNKNGKKKVKGAAKEVKREIKKIERKMAKPSSSASKVAGIRVGDSKLGRTKTKITKNQNCHTVSHDFATEISITSDKTLGNVITTYPLEPDQWDGTRLKQLAGLYEKWKLKSASIEYRPAVATTEPGSFIMYYDPDPSDSAGTTGASLVQKAASANNRVRFQCFEPKNLRFTPPPKTPPMFTSYSEGDEPRLVSYGNIVLVNDVSLTASSTKVYGNLYITLNIEFQRPILEELPASLYYKYDGTWDGSGDDGILNYNHIVADHNAFATSIDIKDQAKNWLTVSPAYDYGTGRKTQEVFFNRSGYYMVSVKVHFTTLGSINFDILGYGMDVLHELGPEYSSASATVVYSAILRVDGKLHYKRSSNAFEYYLGSGFTGGPPALSIFDWDFSSSIPHFDWVELLVTPLPDLGGILNNFPTMTKIKERPEVKDTIVDRLKKLESMFNNKRDPPTKEVVDTCFYCGKCPTDHLSKDCPKKSVK